MAFNCKLSRNISLNPSGSEANDCGSSDIASGGIQERIYVYNIDDIDNLMFENDMRYDNNLIIDTIITSMAYYFIDSTDATYNEEQEGTKHRHTLTLTVANTQPITEDTLNEAVHHRYLVAFRPKGAELYRVFGWKEGAGMSYNMNIDESTNAYTITLSDESEYALMSCLADNFNLANKVFTPIFEPLYDISYCEVTQGNQRTGYCVASYVVKVNSAGQPLDENDKLCYYSENPQDAYKYQGLSDGDYNILGTYTDTASFDGVPVKIFDIERCPISASGTINLNPTEVWLNSTTTYEDVAVNAYSSQGSSNCVAWSVVEKPSEISLSNTSGQTCGTITVISNDIGCDGERIAIRNNVTYEQGYITVYVNLIKVNEEWTYQYGTTEFDIKPTVEPLGSDYTYSIDRSGLTITKLSDGTLHFVVDNPSDQYQTYTLTLTHSNDAREKKYVAINLLGSNVQPVWRMMARYCEEGTTPPSPTEYRWVTVEGQYECVGYDKHSVEKKQISYDTGETWEDVVPSETRTGVIVEENSEYCGYIPPHPPTDYSTMYLTFEALENGTFTFTGTSSNSLSYSLDDGQTWTALASGTASPTVTRGNKIMWKGITTPNTYGIGKFSSSGRFKTYGNIMSIAYGDNFEGQTDLTGKNYVFRNIFDGCTDLMNTQNLVLPATTLTNGCYMSMFLGCTNLVTAPELPATTLTSNCYYAMFRGCSNLATAQSTLPATTLAYNCYSNMFRECSSLVTAPALPATTLVNDCYSDMFYDCTSLVNAPALPATTLANECYSGMFQGCTSLINAPELPATTLTDNCYNSMFQNCSSLNNIKCLATDISATDCTLEWVDDVAASGTFTKAANMSNWTTGPDGIPNGWTVINE